jgi:hypothetical protein
VLVFMYKVKCENVGVSKDSLLTETSDFAILVGQELQDEVNSLFFHLAKFSNQAWPDPLYYRHKQVVNSRICSWSNLKVTLLTFELSGMNRLFFGS